MTTVVWELSDKYTNCCLDVDVTVDVGAISTMEGTVNSEDA